MGSCVHSAQETPHWIPRDEGGGLPVYQCTGLLVYQYTRGFAPSADPKFFDFSGFSGFSVRFPGFSWSGMVRACPGTHFHAQKSIFHHKIKF